MPTPGIVIAALAVALAVAGVQKTVHGVKKVSHQIGCLAKSGHKCPSKQQPSSAPSK